MGNNRIGMLGLLIKLANERPRLLDAWNRRAPPAEGEGWRPIESAPKDGTRIVVGWRGGNHIEAAMFLAGDWCGDLSGYWRITEGPEVWHPMPAAPPATETAARQPEGEATPSSSEGGMREALEAAQRIVDWAEISGKGPADAWPTTCGDAVSVARALLARAALSKGKEG